MASKIFHLGHQAIEMIAGILIGASIALATMLLAQSEAPSRIAIALASVNLLCAGIVAVMLSRRIDDIRVSTRNYAEAQEKYIPGEITSHREKLIAEGRSPIILEFTMASVCTVMSIFILAV